MAFEPLVTIIIQTFNRRNLLEGALQSARNQTYKNIEILIGDNHSEDGTEEYCLEQAKQDPRIRYFRHSENIGMTENAKFLCGKIRGEFHVFVNDDDWMDLDYVEKCVEFYDGRPDYSLVTPSTILYPNNYTDFSQKIGKPCKVISLDDRSVYKRLKKYLRNQDSAEMATGCARTSVLNDIKRVEGQFYTKRYNEDVVFIMKFLVAGKCKVLTNTHLNKRDGGFSKDLKTSNNVYNTAGITEQNLARRRCQIFSGALLTDKYFLYVLGEKDLKRLYKRLQNTLEWFYCQGKFSNVRYLSHLNGTLHLLFHYRLYKL